MEKGQQVELLADYADHYEEIRERKGYGLRNMNGEVKSDEDPHWRYLRNVQTRELAVSALKEINAFYNIHSTMEYIEEGIRNPLMQVFDSFFTALKIKSDVRNVPASPQWVALARMHCISHVLTQRLDYFEKSFKLDPVECGDGMLEECRSWANRLRWTQFHTLLEIDEKLVDGAGVNIRKAIEAEITEQVWYSLRSTLKEPFNGAIWCPVASELVASLSKDVALLIWTDTPDFEELRNRIYSKAAVFAEKVRNTAAAFNSGGDQVRDLEFDGGVTVDSKLMLSQVTLPCAGYTEANSLDAKRLIAALNDLQVYADATALATGLPLLPSFTFHIERNHEPHVMVKLGHSAKESSLRSVPQSVARCCEQ